MWSNNTGDVKIEGGGGDEIEVFTIMNGHEDYRR